MTPVLKHLSTYLLFFGIFFPYQSFAQAFVAGKVTDENKRALAGVNVYQDGGNNGTFSGPEGDFLLEVTDPGTRVVFFSHIGYEKSSRSISGLAPGDTIKMDVNLVVSPSILQPVTVKARPRPETVFASVEFNVADFEFIKDKILLISYKAKIEKDAELFLIDDNSTVFARRKIEPDPIELFKDFEGNVNLVYKDTVFRISLHRNEISLQPINFSDFNELIKPCLDKVDEKIIFSDYVSCFPEFNYYYFSSRNSKIASFKKVSNGPLMREFRYEYYFLPPRGKLEARQLAKELKTDKYVVAAAMTGFQKSFYYTPLYAPLFVINDSILVFDHYENKLYFFNQYTEPIDSIEINYHIAPEEKWSRRLIRDDVKDNIYSLYNKNGFYFLKRLDIKTGSPDTAFRLYNKYAEKIKIHNDYVYYTYRPFESLQKKFLYKEMIIPH